MTIRGLNPKQEKFAQEYLVDFNGTKAAMRAGYSPKTADVQASVLLRNPRVSEFIAARRAKSINKLEVTRERIVAELAKMAFANMGDYIDAEGRVVLADLDRDKLSAISEITTETYQEGRGEEAETVKRVKLKIADKHRALELLGRQFGLSNVATTLIVRDERPDLTLASDDDLAILEAASQVMARLTGPVVDVVATEVDGDTE